MRRVTTILAACCLSLYDSSFFVLCCLRFVPIGSLSNSISDAEDLAEDSNEVLSVAAAGCTLLLIGRAILPHAATSKYRRSSNCPFGNLNRLHLGDKYISVTSRYYSRILGLSYISSHCSQKLRNGINVKLSWHILFLIRSYRIGHLKENPEKCCLNLLLLVSNRLLY